jgi:hypothetical protein
MPSEQLTSVLETIKTIPRERYVFPDAVPPAVDPAELASCAGQDQLTAGAGR